MRAKQLSSVLMLLSHMTFQTSHRLACKSADSEYAEDLSDKVTGITDQTFVFFLNSFEILDMVLGKILDGFLAFGLLTLVN